MSQNQTLNLENIINELQKNLQDIYIIEKELIRLDQMLIAGRSTELKIKDQIEKLKINLQIYTNQKNSLDQIRKEALKNGFVKLSKIEFSKTEQKWQNQSSESYQIIQKNLKQFNHYQKIFYMYKTLILKIIGLDQNNNYHFIDISLPADLKIEGLNGNK